MGTIESLKVPRNRVVPLENKIFKKYKRKEVSLVELIKDCFLAGISTRRIGEVLEDVIGHKIRAQTPPKKEKILRQTEVIILQYNLSINHKCFFYIL